MRALVIDDSRAVRAIIKKILIDIGFEVVEAGNGVEALAALQQYERVHLALVDWNMPEMDGFTFVCQVRGQPAYDHLHLMMVTTETEKEQMVKALAAGANEYITKPFTREGLVSKLVLLNLVECGADKVRVPAHP